MEDWGPVLFCHSKTPCSGRVLAVEGLLHHMASGHRSPCPFSCQGPQEQSGGARSPLESSVQQLGKQEQQPPSSLGPGLSLELGDMPFLELSALLWAWRSY